MTIDKKFLLSLCDICREAGDYIRQEGKNFDTKVVEEKKRFSDLVSYVDKNTEILLVDKLRNLLPGSSILAEEGTHEGGGSYRWIIDPLDGTTNFVHGLPVYSVSVALEKNGDILAGVVYEINRDECFYAGKNLGAFLNGSAIYVSNEKNLSGSLLATGFPYYEFDKLNIYMEILKNFMRSTQGIRRVGSAAVDLAYTACGRFEGFFEYNLKPWDIAAGALLVMEAGGKVTNFKGEPSFLDGVEIIAAGPLHDSIREVINQSW